MPNKLPLNDANSQQYRLEINGVPFEGIKSVEAPMYQREVVHNYRIGSSVPYSTSFGNIVFGELGMVAYKVEWVKMQAIYVASPLRFDTPVRISVLQRATPGTPAQTTVYTGCVLSNADFAVQESSEATTINLKFKPRDIISNGVRFDPIA